MQLDEGCDTGPVFRSASTPIGPTETAGELFDRLAELGGEVLAEFLREFPNVPPAESQDHSLAVHAAKLEKSEGRVDWTRSSRALIDHVRGMDPWPGAFCERGGESLKLFGAGPTTRVVQGAESGTVLGVDDEGMHVACGEGAMVVREVQAPGKRRMPAQQYAAGHPFAAGERLQ
jgi:methionyl-tRNA formyltransferase